MKALYKPGLCLLLLLITACQTRSTDSTHATEITWDSWGVPHIHAQTDEELFFASGWAQMHSHGNTILELYGKSRGRGSEYWGEAHFANDVMVHTLGHPAQAEKMWQQQDPELKILLSAFVNGMNAYAERYPETILDVNRQVLPLNVADVNMHGLFVVNTRFVADRELGMVRRWEEKSLATVLPPSAPTGSNTLAIAPSHSASGNAMLVQNPHLPWYGEFLFYEMHLNTPRNNIYGATLVGLPGVAIAFNDFLGWSHTNNTIDNADLYLLTLAEGGYEFDGAVKPFETSTAQIRVRREDGSMSVKDIAIHRSIHGPVVKMGEASALALRLVGSDRPNSILQWWRMANAQDFEQFEQALKMEQLAFWNVMYADRDGNIFYLFNGQVPKRGHGDWAYWQGLVPGDDSANVWGGVHGFDDLPKTLNPDTGWLQNANDPPWTSTYPLVLDADAYPAYMAPRRMSFRPQRAVRMMVEDESITFDELVAYKHSTRMEMADRLLDDLFAAIDEHGSELAQEAKTVLERWDRQANPDSRGATLFYAWASAINPYRQSNYARPWNEADPRGTPDGLADPNAAVQALEEAARQSIEKYGALDVAWGEVFRINYNGSDLPGHGAPGSVGVFRVAWPAIEQDNILFVGGGDSWVSVIEFGDQPRARVLLSYGNSTQQGSPHFGDQLPLFSEGRLRDAWRTREALEGHIERIDVLDPAPLPAQ